MGIRFVRRRNTLQQLGSRFIRLYRFVIAPRPRLNSFLNTLLALAGLAWAINTYYDQQSSGREQQAALDASRKALQSVVTLFQEQKAILDKSRNALELVAKSSKEQQQIVNRSLSTSTEQLATLRQQWKEEQQRFGRKPKFETTIADYTKAELENQKGVVALDTNRWGIIPLVVKNIGNASATKTYMFCKAEPSGVRLSDFRGFNSRDQNEFYPNIFTYRGFQEMDIPPFSDVKLPYLFYCYVLVPKGISAFSISFSIYSSNAEVYNIKANIVTQP